MLPASGREDRCAYLCPTGTFSIHKGVRMKGRKRVDKCFSFSEIPVMLTLLSEQATLVLMTTSEKNRPNLFGEKKLA